MKEASPGEVEKTGLLAKQCCDKYGAELYIDDHVEVCRNIRARGVHLGKTDMPPQKARRILGKDFIIGGTANTFDDIRRLNSEGVSGIALSSTILQVQNPVEEMKRIIRIIKTDRN
jgi:thiamine-phosphate pyrophosphorylase